MDAQSVQFSVASNSHPSAVHGGFGLRGAVLELMHWDVRIAAVAVISSARPIESVCGCSAVDAMFRFGSLQLDFSRGKLKMDHGFGCEYVLNRINV